MKIFILKKGLLTYFTLLFFSSQISAQTGFTDSLENKLSNYLTIDSFRVNLLNKIAYESHRSDLIKATNYLDSAIFYGNQIDYTEGLITSYRYYGLIMSRNSNFKEAIDFYNKGITILKNSELSNNVEAATTYDGLGTVHLKTGNYKAAIENFEEAITINTRLKNNKDLGVNYNHMAVAYLQQSEYEQGRIFLKKAFFVNVKLGNVPKQISVLANAGNTYAIQYNYPVAIEYYFKAIELNESLLEPDINFNIKMFNNLGCLYMDQEDYKRSLEYLNKALSLSRLHKKSEGEGLALMNLGLFYGMKNELNKAKINYEQALNIFKATNAKVYMSDCMGNLAEVLIKLKDYGSAESILNQGILICKEIRNRRSLTTQYRLLSQVYHEKGEFNLGLKYALEAEELAEKFGLLGEHSEAENMLSVIYASLGKHKLAYDKLTNYKILSL